MFTLLIAVASGGAVVAVGLLVGNALLRQNLRAIARQKLELQLGREVMNCVRELAKRVASDVNAHGRRVQEISDELTSRTPDGIAEVVESIASLVQANRELQDRMADAETQLRAHSRALDSFVVEARTDALTGLPNRRALDAEIAQRIADSQRQDLPFSIVLLDLDRFKRVNDRFGHLAGDETLRGVAGALRQSLKEMQQACRFGGEEFVVTLPATSLESACQIAERLRLSVAQLRFKFQDRDVSITMSAGVAQLLPGEDTTLLLHRADQALLVAKNRSRNTVCWHDGRCVQGIKGSEPQAPANQSAAPDANNTAEAIAAEKENVVVPPPAKQTTSDVLPTASAIAPPTIDVCDRSRIFLYVRQRMAEWKRGGPEFSVVLLQVEQGPSAASADSRLAPDPLTTVRRILSAHLRDMDVAGHYAPCRFALLLPLVCLGDATMVAQRLVVAAGQLADSGEQRCTFSAGVAEVQEGDDVVALFQRTEAALASAEGNSVCAHDGTALKVSPF